ncbi:hypothetical protein ACQZ4P_25020, partial [Agrobacterium vitis]
LKSLQQSLFTLNRFRFKELCIKAVGKAKKRLYLNGGAAPLYLADGRGHTVLSAPGFLPEARFFAR